MNNQTKLNRLCNIRTDLRDDADHINKINSKIQKISDDFGDLFKSYSNRTTARTNIEALKISSITNDFNLQNALTYCQNEINIVDAEIKAEQQKK